MHGPSGLCSPSPICETRRKAAISVVLGGGTGTQTFSTTPSPYNGTVKRVVCVFLVRRSTCEHKCVLYLRGGDYTRCQLQVGDLINNLLVEIIVTATPVSVQKKKFHGP
jgi:hypothetical protein